jgi:hypothetical protein
MSQQAESIPCSPTPGKDPPPASSAEADAAPPHESEIKPEAEAKLKQESESASKSEMPPPTLRNPRQKPRITTQPPSTSNIHHTSLTGSRQPSLSLSRAQQSILQYSQPQEAEVYRPPFSPFFTLINDSSVGGDGGEGKGETIHPRKIHYIFSDDDISDLLTSSLIHSLHPTTSTSSSPAASRELSSSQRESSSSSSATFRNPSKTKDKTREKMPKEKKEKEERVIIIDINETGTGVKSVSSLSPAWQVLNASISNAPTFDASSEQDPQSQNLQERGLMLRIEGVSASSLITDSAEFASKESRDGKEGGSAVLGEEEMSQLLEGFDRKMGVLRRIISARASKEDLEVCRDGCLDEEELGTEAGAAVEGLNEGRRGSEEVDDGKEVGSG